MSGAVVMAAMVPGMPHLLAAKPSKGWAVLAQAARQLGDDLRAAGVQTLMVVSTQWVSVLGLQVQMRASLQGTRVDENWYPYDFGTLAYSLHNDVPLAERWMQELRGEGFQARPTSHPDFPIDTGLVVAATLLDPQGGFEVVQVSLNLYGTPESVEKVGAAAARAAQASGRRVALLAVGGLSSHPLRTWINPERDAISSPADERSNQRVLAMLAAGRCEELFAAREDIVPSAAMDGQLRALSFIHGGAGLARPARVRAYAPVWGMGAAVVDWPMTTDQQDTQGATR